ncbi:type II secretion system protein GspM [Rubrivivax sp. RP6-9]|uniref:type II secretion system protein GspM n=1 Tax=Rubrivivax sp. RP6-9 TaxID=3415750 RepID=UPI003CC62984
MNATARQAALAPLRAWWSGLAARERQLVALCAAVLLAFGAWLVLVQPALRTVRTAPAQLDALAAELQSMQLLAAEARELRNTPPVNVEQSAAALRAASERLGTKARLSLQGERAVLTLNGVGTEELRSWLGEVRSGARARPVEASLTRGAAGYSGSIVVALGGAA